jgi:HAD superfamily hydrolase (TIGR01549 family)
MPPMPLRLPFLDRSRPSRRLLDRLRRAGGWAFDWDGTLIDSIGRTLSTYQQLFREFEVPFDEHVFRRHYSPDWRRLYGRVGLAESRWADADRRWLQLYESEASPLVRGAGEALDRLRRLDVPLVLVSAGERKRVELEVRANGLTDVFTAAVYGDEVPHRKPDPAPVLLAARYAHLKPDQLVVVGDHPDDMLMAHRAGAIPIGVLTGASDRGSLKSAGARWSAPTVVDVVGPVVDGRR